MNGEIATLMNEIEKEFQSKNDQIAQRDKEYQSMFDQQKESPSVAKSCRKKQNNKRQKF